MIVIFLLTYSEKNDIINKILYEGVLFMKHNSKRSSFGGSLGFILAAAGSAVGLGNIWRFPYLAAKDGGGLFLVVYIILALTFGFTLLTTEIAIGRKTKQSALTAYSKVKKGWKPIGVIAELVPVIILPYYCVIGGWVVKYLVAFIKGEGIAAAADGYFTGFITAQYAPIVYMAIFMAMIAFIVYRGVNKGIESSSKILMPALLLMVIFISIFNLTIRYTDADGVTRTGLEGLKVFVVPSLEGITFGKFVNVVIDAMGQLFFSLSVAMGIMVTYGSYVSDDANLNKSINRIEIFDTLIAFLAGVMIIPSVFVFVGREGMEASGPSLMFISLPKVFAEMGAIGRVIGILFFAMVLFAAVTSAVSVLETVVAGIMDQTGLSRIKSTTIEIIFAVIWGVIVCLGYNKLYFEYTLPNGSVAQILDIMDYISNNIFMPIVAIATCILIGWVVKPKYVIDEVEKNGNKLGRKNLYVLMVKFIAPALLLILFFKSVGVLG